MIWAYGLTTVPSRIDDLLPKTLESLEQAGFGTPSLFVDGVRDNRKYQHFGLPTITRWPQIRTYGNWILALWELFIRMPTAHRYAMFQDDFVTYKNLRGYLDRCGYPEKGYCNLYTMPHNLARCGSAPGWYESCQMGKGGVALVFSRKALTTLLGQEHMAARIAGPRGWKAVDGAVVTAMKKARWKEYIHNPSLVQHMGVISSMHNSRHPLANSFRGEDFDAMDLLPRSEK